MYCLLLSLLQTCLKRQEFPGAARASLRCEPRAEQSSAKGTKNRKYSGTAGPIYELRRRYKMDDIFLLFLMYIYAVLY